MRIEWNEECIREDNPKVTVQYLTTHKYNADKTSEGVWREYFNKKTKKQIDPLVNHGLTLY